MSGKIDLSPAIEYQVEQFAFAIQCSAFNETQHLKERERQYCMSNLHTHGLFIIRETQDGWWRESIDFKGDVGKQVEKLMSDPTVACGWINAPRFNEPGGWYDPTA